MTTPPTTDIAQIAAIAGVTVADVERHFGFDTVPDTSQAARQQRNAALRAQLAAEAARLKQSEQGATLARIVAARATGRRPPTGFI